MLEKQIRNQIKKNGYVGYIWLVFKGREIQIYLIKKI
jgi:hypothetical protein